MELSECEPELTTPEYESSVSIAHLSQVLSDNDPQAHQRRRLNSQCASSYVSSAGMADSVLDTGGV